MNDQLQDAVERFNRDNPDVPDLVMENVQLRAEVERRATGVVLVEIGAERERQLAKGYTPEHDDAYKTYEISTVAAAVALGASDHVGGDVPDWADYIIARHGTRRRLVIAASLLVAEIERLDRASTPAPAPRRSM